MSNSSSSSNKQIARAASTVMFAYVLSNLVGLIRQVLVSNTFGTNSQLDAFYAAVTIPDLLFNLLAGGALASAFIPIFTDVLKKENSRLAFNLFSSIVSLILLVLGIGSLITVYFAPTIVSKVIFVFQPNLDSGLLQLTINLLSIIMIAPTIFGISGIVMGVLNTHQKFLIPALAPVVNWLGWIIGIVFIVPTQGIFGLAWGYVIGACLHLLVQIPVLLSLEKITIPTPKDLMNNKVIQILKLMGPRLFGVGAVQINFLINTMLATSLGEGSLSAINIGRMIMTMPLFVIAQAIATAALPTFSAQVAKNEKADMVHSLTATLRGVLVLSIPASIGLIILRNPITAILFQRGKFDAHSTELVAWAILWYTAGLVGHAIVEILSRAFYALHDTKTPVTIGILAMGLNVVLSFVFVALFTKMSWMPHGGLALANSLATAIEAGFLLYYIRKHLGGIEIKALGVSFFQFTLASLLMVLCIYGWQLFSAGYGDWIEVLGGVVFGAIAYLFGLILLRIPELSIARAYITKVLSRVSRR